MNSFDSAKTLPHRLYHDPVSGWFVWDVEVDGEIVAGQESSFAHALQKLNLVISAAGYPPIEQDTKRHTTKAPHLLRQGSRTLAYFRENVLPGLLASLGFVAIGNLAVLIRTPSRFPEFEWIQLFPLLAYTLIASIRRIWIIREWNSTWRPSPSPASLPWPWSETRPPGDPTKSPPLPWMGKNHDARDEEETSVFEFLNAARLIFFQNSPESHPLLDALRERALEKQAHAPDQFKSPTTSLQQSIDEWMGDRLRNMRYSTRFVRDAYDANPPRNAKPRCRINYIQSASDFSKEWNRLCSLRALTQDAASYMVAASLFLVPMAAYFCWTYKWELGLPPRFYLVVTIALPAAILALRATMRRAREEGQDLDFQYREAKLLAPVEDAYEWSSISYTVTPRR